MNVEWFDQKLEIRIYVNDAEVELVESGGIDRYWFAGNDGDQLGGHFVNRGNRPLEILVGHNGRDPYSGAPFHPRSPGKILQVGEHMPIIRIPTGDERTALHTILHPSDGGPMPDLDQVYEFGEFRIRVFVLEWRQNRWLRPEGEFSHGMLLHYAPEAYLREHGHIE